jgi:hypothetical protein
VKGNVVDDAKTIRLYLPGDLAQELETANIVEEAVRVRNLTEVATLAVNVVNTGAALVAVAGGALSLKRFAGRVVEWVHSRDTAEPIKLTLTHHGASECIELSADPSEAEQQVAQLMAKLIDPRQVSDQDPESVPRLVTVSPPHQ